MRMYIRVLFAFLCLLNIAYAYTFAQAYLRGFSPDDLGGQFLLHVTAAVAMFAIMVLVDGRG